ncbi:hypothetical protein ACVIN2_002752 [Bradyrhizobium sp. USDA 3650]
MSKERNCLIVRAAGRQLDLLRGEASRIAKGSNVDWWIDQAEVGTRFCFEDVKAKESFAHSLSLVTTSVFPAKTPSPRFGIRRADPPV